MTVKDTFQIYERESSINKNQLVKTNLSIYYTF